MTSPPDPFRKLKPETETRGRIVYYDLETIPDESRFDPPASPTIGENEIYAPDVAKLPVADIKAAIPQMTDKGLSDLESMELAKDKSRKGVLDVVDTELKRRNNAFSDWVKSHSVDPLRCRIIAAAWAVDNGEPHVMLADDDAAERELIGELWSVISSTQRRCGYNICGFDDTVLGIRSLVLGVDPIGKLDRRKFNNSQAIDLMQMVSPTKSYRCKDVARALGIDVPAGDFDGANVYDSWVNEDRESIARYVTSDVVIEREIHKRLQRVFV